MWGSEIFPERGMVLALSMNMLIYAWSVIGLDIKKSDLDLYDDGNLEQPRRTVSAAEAIISRYPFSVGQNGVRFPDRHDKLRINHWVA